MTIALDLFAGLLPPPLAEPSPSESEKREQAMDLHERQRARYLEQLRRAMRVLWWARQQAVATEGSWQPDPQAQPETEAWVCADDARRLFESWRPPADINRNFLGAVFRGDWIALSRRRVHSTTPGSHANELKCWTLRP